jgi:hypothetical protein
MPFILKKLNKLYTTIRYELSSDPVPAVKRKGRNADGPSIMRSLVQNGKSPKYFCNSIV